MKFTDIAVVVLGAGLGGGLRYALGGWLAERWGSSFPWHTMAVNLSGAFLLGILMALSLDRGIVSAGWRLFLGVGLLGGYTTFSTLAYESMALLERGLVLQGFGNMLASGLAGLVAVLAGLWVGRVI
ncbi:MAG: fluoride efflux transporter CrcB [Coriobacteriia bacterium]